MLCLLGPAALHTGKQLQPLSLRPKTLALLVRLAWSPGPQDRDALAEMLFPDAIIRARACAGS